MFGKVGDSSSAPKEIGNCFGGGAINSFMVEGILCLGEFGRGEGVFLNASNVMLMCKVANVLNFLISNHGCDVYACNGE